MGQTNLRTTRTTFLSWDPDAARADNLPRQDLEYLPDEDEQKELQKKLAILYLAIKNAKFKCCLIGPMLAL